MKCYKATYYVTKPEVNEEKRVIAVMIYANDKKQAKTLATAYMVDFNDMNKVEVAETKSKLAIDLMNMYIKEHNGEDQLLKDEIDDINSRRSRFGLEPIK